MTSSIHSIAHSMSSLDLTRDWLKSVLRPYPGRERVLAEVLSVLGKYRTLAVKTEAYTFDSGQTVLLLLLHGTLPITYKGSTYHIPVNIWTPHEYPRAPPIAYVVPTREMGVRKGKEVEPGGRVREDFIDPWWRSPGTRDIPTFIAKLVEVFSAVPPVYAKPPEQQQAQPSSSRSGSSSGPSQATQPANGPPPPARPFSGHYQQSNGESLPQYRPAPSPPTLPPAPGMPLQPPQRQGPLPLSPQQQGSVSGGAQPPVPQRPFVAGRSQSPQVASPISSSGAPPWGQHQRAGSHSYPPGPGMSPTPPPQTSAGPSGQPPLPPKPFHGPPPFQQPHQQQQQVYPLSVPNGSTPQAMMPHGQPPPPPQLPHQQHQPPYPPQTQPQAQYPPQGGYPPQLQQHYHPQPPQVQQQYHQHPIQQSDSQHAPRQPVDFLTTSPEASTSSLPDPDEAPPLPPSKPPPPSQLHLHSILLPHLHASLAPLVGSLQAEKAHLLERREDLASGEPAIRDEMARLEAVKNVCDVVGGKLEKACEAGSKRVAELEERGDVSVDEVVCGISIVHNQLIDLVAEDNAISDTIYHVTRALDAERLDLDRYLKAVRALAREQYMKRALVERILQGMGHGTWEAAS